MNHKFLILVVASLGSSPGSCGFFSRREVDSEAATSALPTPSKCPPKLESVKDLDLNRYLGTWFQARSLPSFFQPPGTKCISATYQESGSSKPAVLMFQGNNTFIIWNTNVKPDGGFSEICGAAERLDSETPGEFFVKFPFSPVGSNMQILATDYDNYAAVYSCLDFPVVGKFEYAWVLTRSPFPSAKMVAEGRDALAAHGVDVDRLETIEHDRECTYEKLEGVSCFDEAKSKIEAEKAEAANEKTEVTTEVINTEAGKEDSEAVGQTEEPSLSSSDK